VSDTINKEGLPYLRNSAELTSLNGTGWNANKFSILTQLVPPNGTLNSGNWSKFDYTNRLNGYGTWGSSTIDKNIAFTNGINLHYGMITSGSTYDLNPILNMPQISQTGKLNFGSEQYAMMILDTQIQATVFRTKIFIKMGFSDFNWTTNNSYTNPQDSVYASEVAIYSGNQMVAIGKFSYPISKNFSQVSIIEVDMDF